MAAELGIGGIATLLLFCGAVLWAGVRQRGTLAAGDRLVKVGALGMFAAWLADTSFDWLYDIAGLTAMAMLSAALLVVPSGAASRVPVRRTRLARAALAVGVAVLALLAAGLGRQYVSVRYAEAGARQVSASPRAAIGNLREAARLDPFSPSILYSLAGAYARLDDYARARQALLLAAQREPFNYVPPALLGDLAMRRRLYRLAVTEYEHARALNPRDPFVRASEKAAREALK
jgi:tetratricopeptide (TPR) repeat protein